VKSHTVWITRLDGPRADEAGVIRAETDGFDLSGPFCLKQAGEAFRLPVDRNGRVLRTPPILLDLRTVPLEARRYIYEKWHDRVRLSRRGWDRFLLGEFAYSTTDLRTLLDQIKKSCLARGLLFKFEIRRCMNPDKDPDAPTRCYLVSRVR
jgi:hypothetical protein